jgi:hypothetical protein
MGSLEDSLVRKALRRHKRIVPVGRNGRSCFTRAMGRLYFWYNTADNSTHVVAATILRNKRVRRVGRGKKSPAHRR